MKDHRLTQNEREALVRLIQAAQDAKTIPEEDRALVHRAKKKVEQMETQKQARPPPKAKSDVRQTRWE
jgi:hypothetical protein